MNRLQLPGRVATTWFEAAAHPVEVVVSTRARDRIAAGHSAAIYDGSAPTPHPNGHHLPEHLVRAAMLAHLAWLAEGTSGASPDSVDALAAALRTTFTPAVGHRSDPMSSVLHALCGTGFAHLDGQLHDAGEALRRAGLRPLDLTTADVRAFTGNASVMAAAAGLLAARLRAGVLLATEALTRATQGSPVSRSGELVDAIERLEQLLQESSTFDPTDGWTA